MLTMLMGRRFFSTHIFTILDIMPMFISRTKWSTSTVVAFISVLIVSSLFVHASATHADGPITWQVDAASTTGTCASPDYICTTVQAAITGASDGDTVSLLTDITLSSQISVNKAITLEGNGRTLHAAFTKTTNSNNSAIGITHSDVVVQNVSIDGTGGVSLHGINIYLSSNVGLNGVTISNNGSGAAVIVNGSSVAATNLNTANNSWGAVNIDPGSGVTVPSEFTLNSGTLGESNQIWSDGAHVTPTATVTVSAGGYTQYKVAGTVAYYVWGNKPVANTVTLTDGATNTLYSSIQAAVDAATVGQTVKLSSDMTITSEVLITKGLTIDGAGHTLFAQINNSANSNSNNAGLGLVGATDTIVVKNITVDGTSSTKIHGINIFESSDVTLNDVIVQNNTKSGITVNGSTVAISNVTTRNNAWGGINADQALDAPHPTVVTITGTSTHTESGPDVWVDNNLRNVTVNDTTSQYSSSTYTHDTSIIGTVYGIKAATVTNEAELRAALSDPFVQTITFGSDITTAGQININRSVTINGADHSLNAAFNSASVIQITANDVTLRNLIENASGTTGNRGINIYKVTGILLDSVTASNNSKNGIVVNGSVVTVNNISTSGNGWEGIDVDLGVGVTTPASLTVNGVSFHSETKAAIRIDDTTKSVSVTDTNNQYIATNTGVIRDFTLNQKKVKTTAPSQETTTSGGVTVTVDVPASTIITGSDLWDGILQAPTATTKLVTISGFDSVVTSAVSIGSDQSDLTFDKAVKLTFAGQTGTHVGWFNHSGTFTEITTACTDNTQSTNDGLSAGADCKIEEGGDLIVWTKHFSTFTTYTQTAIAGNSNGGGGGGGTTSVVEAVQTTGSIDGGSTGGQVLGVETYNFARNLTVGSTGDDVIELQKVLIAAGYLKIAEPTGYFGPLTKAAVKLYQGAHGVITTGFVGPLTRAALNEPAPASSTENEQITKLKLILDLFKQVLVLQTQLNALVK